MRIETLEEAISEAKRFLNKANVARKRLKQDPDGWYGCKETAAAKRASMDLTRALAELRKPN